jgi:selenide,water dikinase
METDGAAHNRRFVASSLTVLDSVPPELVALAHDPQTSGGILAAVPADRADAVVDVMQIAGIPCHLIGRVEEGDGIPGAGALVLG